MHSILKRGVKREVYNHYITALIDNTLTPFTGLWLHFHWEFCIYTARNDASKQPNTVSSRSNLIIGMRLTIKDFRDRKMIVIWWDSCRPILYSLDTTTKHPHGKGQSWSIVMDAKNTLLNKWLIDYFQSAWVRMRTLSRKMTFFISELSCNMEHFTCDSSERYGTICFVGDTGVFG